MVCSAFRSPFCWKMWTGRVGRAVGMRRLRGSWGDGEVRSSWAAWAITGGVDSGGEDTVLPLERG